MVVPAYLLAMVGAQVVLGFVSTSLGVLANAVLLVVSMNHALAGGRLAEEQDGRSVGASADVEAVAVLALLPLLGVLRGAVPLPGGSVASWTALTAAMLVSALLVARPAPVRSLVSLLAVDPFQLPIALTGALLALAAFVALQPRPAVDHADGASVVLGAVVVLLAAGAVWELIFRGMVLPTLASALPGTGVSGAAVASAAAAAGTGSVGYAVLMFVTGLVLGAAVARTGTILGAAIAHGLLNVCLLVVWPAVLG